MASHEGKMKKCVSQQAAQEVITCEQLKENSLGTIRNQGSSTKIELYILSIHSFNMRLAAWK
jgi:hypothetical protein